MRWTRCHIPNIWLKNKKPTLMKRVAKSSRNCSRNCQKCERTVMMLHYLGEMTIKAISEFVGVSQNTVKSRLSRARNRLKKEENMIHQNLGSFQLPAQLTENIMRQVSRITPTTPAGNKPMIPWCHSAASAVLILLLMGVGTQYLSRFQQPYNLNATSERSVEIIEALFVLETPAKPDVRNQAGSSAVPGKSAGAGQKPDTLLFAAVPVDEVEVSTPKPQWIQTKGPEGGQSIRSLLHLMEIFSPEQAQISIESQTMASMEPHQFQHIL